MIRRLHGLLVAGRSRYGLVGQLFVDPMTDSSLWNTLRDEKLLPGTDDSDLEPRGIFHGPSPAIGFPFTLLPIRHWRRARDRLES
jgi:hypothetical protein